MAKQYQGSPAYEAIPPKVPRQPPNAPRVTPDQILKFQQLQDQRVYEDIAEGRTSIGRGAAEAQAASAAKAFDKEKMKRFINHAKMKRAIARIPEHPELMNRLFSKVATESPVQLADLPTEIFDDVVDAADDAFGSRKAGLKALEKMWSADYADPATGRWKPSLLSERLPRLVERVAQADPRVQQVITTIEEMGGITEEDYVTIFNEMDVRNVSKDKQKFRIDSSKVSLEKLEEDLIPMEDLDEIEEKYQKTARPTTTTPRQVQLESDFPDAKREPPIEQQGSSLSTGRGFDSGADQWGTGKDFDMRTNKKWKSLRTGAIGEKLESVVDDKTLQKKTGRALALGAEEFTHLQKVLADNDPEGIVKAIDRFGGGKYWDQIQPGLPEARKLELATELKVIHEQSRGTYGKESGQQIHARIVEDAERVRAGKKPKKHQPFGAVKVSKAGKKQILDAADQLLEDPRWVERFHNGSLDDIDDVLFKHHQNLLEWHKTGDISLSKEQLKAVQEAQMYNFSQTERRKITNQIRDKAIMLRKKAEATGEYKAGQRAYEEGAVPLRPKGAPDPLGVRAIQGQRKVVGPRTTGGPHLPITTGARKTTPSTSTELRLIKEGTPGMSVATEGGPTMAGPKEYRPSSLAQFEVVPKDVPVSRDVDALLIPETHRRAWAMRSPAAMETMRSSDAWGEAMFRFMDPGAKKKLKDATTKSGKVRRGVLEEILGPELLGKIQHLHGQELLNDPKFDPANPIKASKQARQLVGYMKTDEKYYRDAIDKYTGEGYSWNQARADRARLRGGVLSTGKPPTGPPTDAGKVLRAQDPVPRPVASPEAASLLDDIPEKVYPETVGGKAGKVVDTVTDKIKSAVGLGDEAADAAGAIGDVAKKAKAGFPWFRTGLGAAFFALDAKQGYDMYQRFKTGGTNQQEMATAAQMNARSGDISALLLEEMEEEELLARREGRLRRQDPEAYEALSQMISPRKVPAPLPSGGFRIGGSRGGQQQNYSREIQALLGAL
jgi:hypothetical protein